MGKKIIIIAGPNGAGKTTFAREFLPAEANCPRFINADVIAAGLSPFAPETVAIKAGKLMVGEIAEAVARGESFRFETTLSGSAYLRHIAAWRSLGYRVKRFFLALSSPEVAIERVAHRVSQGGHHIPALVIRRRFAAGLQKLVDYKSAVDSWAMYDELRPEMGPQEWSDDR